MTDSDGKSSPPRGGGFWLDNGIVERISTVGPAAVAVYLVLAKHVGSGGSVTQGLRKSHNWPARPKDMFVCQSQDPKNKNQKTRTRPKVNGSYSEAFLAFWEHYPRKTAKRKAATAYQSALKAIRAEHDSSADDAHQRLLAAVRAFETSDKGRGDPQYIPYPTTFLNEGRYDDDPNEWRETRSGNGTARSGRPVRSTDSVARPRQRYGGDG